MADIRASTLGGAYYPAPNGETMMFKVTVTNSSTRLGTLMTIPSIDNTDNAQSGSYPWSQPPGKRPPHHVFFQVPSAAAAKVYLSVDSVTTPVAGDGGPGIELQPGVVYPFENAGPLLSNPGTGKPYQINAGSAFQLVATTASQVISVWFAD